MTNGQWVPVLEEAKLEEDALTEAFPKGIGIILVKTGGRVYALRNRCAHMACPLAGGALDGFTVECSCHDWRFDVRTGEFLDAPEVKVPTFETRTKDGQVLVKLEG
jgi:nitrite reductase/ring-hydroxylating ferredoxin subunit